MDGTGKRHTLQSQMDVIGGPTHGFDYMRILLALAVVVWHAILISYGSRFVEHLRGFDALRPLHVFILPMFFCLSGFLVTGSLLRVNLPQFVALRALRIVPALFVEITLSALLLGPLVTTYGLPEYFTDGQFLSYFLNIIGWVHYYLPGVFLDNPHPGKVNGQLWTIPYELECYLALALLAATRVVRFRVVFLAIVAIAILIATVHSIQHPPAKYALVTGRVLVSAFLTGVCAYLFKDVLPFDARLCWVSAALTGVLLIFPQFNYLATVPLGYVTAYLGLCHPKANFLIKGGDYSYGVYLFHFPIMQALALMAWARHWWVEIALGLPLTVAFAALSWKLVEKPAIDQKKKVLKLLTLKPTAPSSAEATA